MAEKLRSLGLCLGASTVSIVELEIENRSGSHLVSAGDLPRQSTDGISPLPADGRPKIIDYHLYPHEGDPKRTLLKAFERLDLNAFDRIAATGRKFRKFVNLSAIPEPEAVEYAYRFVKPAAVDCPAVVSAGGETFMVYVLDC